MAKWNETSTTKKGEYETEFGELETAVQAA